MEDKRLIWIRIISGYLILLGLLGLAIGIIFLILMWSAYLSWAFWPVLLFLTIFALCFLVGGIGLFFIKTWAREIVVIGLWFSIVLSIIIMFGTLININISNLLILIQIALYILILWYLNRKSIKALFLLKTTETTSITSANPQIIETK